MPRGGGVGQAGPVRETHVEPVFERQRLGVVVGEAGFARQAERGKVGRGPSQRTVPIRSPFRQMPSVAGAPSQIAQPAQ